MRLREELTGIQEGTRPDPTADAMLTFTGKPRSVALSRAGEQKRWPPSPLPLRCRSPRAGKVQVFQRQAWAGSSSGVSPSTMPAPGRVRRAVLPRTASRRAARCGVPRPGPGIRRWRRGRHHPPSAAKPAFGDHRPCLRRASRWRRPYASGVVVDLSRVRRRRRSVSVSAATRVDEAVVTPTPSSAGESRSAPASTSASASRMPTRTACSVSSSSRRPRRRRRASTDLELPSPRNRRRRRPVPAAGFAARTPTVPPSRSSSTSRRVVSGERADTPLAAMP